MQFYRDISIFKIAHVTKKSSYVTIPHSQFINRRELARIVYQIIPFMRPVLLCILCLLSFFGKGAEYCDIGFSQNYIFRYLSVNNGLSQNSITAIMQDRKGFMWIGTYDGLNRFDGFAVQTKRHISGNSNSLSDNRILSLHETVNGMILIGTDGDGINLLDPQVDSIRHLEVNKNDILRNTVQTITSDKYGNIWAGTTRGLAIINPGGKIFFIERLKNCNIKSLITDHQGDIWAATNQGLFHILLQGSKTLRNITLTSVVQHRWISAVIEDRNRNIWAATGHDVLKISNNTIGYQYSLPALAEATGIKQDLEGNLWLSSKNSGIFRLKLNNHTEVQSIDQYATNKAFCNIAENSANTLFIDRSNTLWVGTYQKGINYTDLSSKKFYSFLPLMENREGIFGYQGKYISTIAETPNDLWIGTFNEGLYIYDKCNKKLQSYRSEIGSTSICAIEQAKNGTIWIGGSDGLYQVTNAGSSGKKQISTIKIGFVARSICEDKAGNLWIASFTGIHIYSPSTRTFKTITTANGISSNAVYVVYYDPLSDMVWAGTIGGGLNAIRSTPRGSYKIAVYKHKPNGTASLSSNHVWSIYKDQKNTLWVGTDAGLNALKLNNKAEISDYKTISGAMLSDRKIMAILEDKAGNLWLSSSQGLFRYNIQSGATKRYTFQDGLQSNTLNEAAFQNQYGVMYFGGINGLNYFKPANIRNNPFEASPVFTELRISNQPVGIGQKVNDKVILAKDINYTSNITLTYRHRDFAIGFSSLHFASPESNLFRYKLDGYDKHWITSDNNQRLAAYANLDPGRYRFLLQSSNNDGSFSSHISTIIIDITPAPWASWWAKTLYVLLFLLAGAFLVNYSITKNRLRTEIFQEKLEKEKVTELNEIKLNFFTTITHEIRTPLNLIISPLQDLLGVANVYDHYTKMRLKIIYRNSMKLFTLINQVLDLRKISSESEKLVIREADLVKTILNVKESFDWQAGQHNIRLDFDSPRTIKAWFDQDKIEKIIFNLLSNAFKYTPSGGKIAVSLEADAKQATITVQDTGIGIQQEEQDRIFEMYYQSTAHFNSGTGIGLSLSKKLVEMHYGEISLVSDGNSGSKFTVVFPIAREGFQAEDIREIMEPAKEDDTSPEPEHIHISKKTVLIIEDNEDQRAYLRECLTAHFHVLDAANGAEGVEIAQKMLPDIIITDLMMPAMDGMDVCRKVKSNAKTAHIPVIVHSINNTGQSVKNALLAGADDFIAKPYDYAMLTLKINNILRSKNQLLLNMHKQTLSSPAEVSIPSVDKELLEKIVSYVEQNMADNQLSVEKIADHIGMSRMNLHRRLHAILGKTASEFIREIRIKRAGQLLATGSKRISEVMFEIGISSNAHFNKYFKEMYGIAPKEYIKQASNTTNES